MLKQPEAGGSGVVSIEVISSEASEYVFLALTALVNLNPDLLPHSTRKIHRSGPSTRKTDHHQCANQLSVTAIIRAIISLKISAILWKEKIYFGSRFGNFQSMIDWPYSFGPVTRCISRLKGMVEQNHSPHEQEVKKHKGKGWSSTSRALSDLRTSYQAPPVKGSISKLCHLWD